jgi:hypothetical protein
VVEVEKFWTGGCANGSACVHRLQLDGNESTPVVRFMLAIQCCLGYNPLPRAVSLGARLRAAA